MEWPKPSSARSSVTMSASVRVRMQTPSCSSYQFGSLTTTRFTRTRHSDIVHPVSSSQLTEARDRVRSFGGYNTETELVGWVGGLELRNAVAKYPFERSHRFPVIQPNCGRRDYSRSSCDGGRRSSGLVPGSRQDACAGRNCRDFLPR